MNQVFVAEGSKYKYYPRPEPVFATQPFLQHNRRQYIRVKQAVINPRLRKII